MVISFSDVSENASFPIEIKVSGNVILVKE